MNYNKSIRTEMKIPPEGTALDKYLPIRTSEPINKQHTLQQPQKSDNKGKYKQ